MPSSPEEKYSLQQVTWVHAWGPELVSFRVTRPAGYSFTAGQFARLGIARADADNPKNPSGRKIVWRAFSMASAPEVDQLEFYAITVAGGEFTHDLAELAPGAHLYVENIAYGFLTLDRFADGKELWMVATGTGISPYLSMLAGSAPWQRFESLVLVHSVRIARELAYRETIESFMQRGRLSYVPVVTRETMVGALQKRIPALVADGELAAAAGVTLAAETSRVMMCGNPAMVDDLRTELKLRGFVMPRRGAPGNMIVENYW